MCQACKGSIHTGSFLFLSGVQGVVGVTRQRVKQYSVPVPKVHGVQFAMGEGMALWAAEAGQNILLQLLCHRAKYSVTITLANSSWQHAVTTFYTSSELCAACSCSPQHRASAFDQQAARLLTLPQHCMLLAPVLPARQIERAAGSMLPTFLTLPQYYMLLTPVLLAQAKGSEHLAACTHVAVARLWCLHKSDLAQGAQI
eukprot:1152728-Pelagomonas_calceolata.AAC.3